MSSSLIISVAIPVLGGFLSALPTREAVRGWYSTINKPSFNPPNWLFAPAWTTLYILMGYASYRVKSSNDETTAALTLYWIQLGFNFMWSPLFFYFKRIDLAMVNISIHWILILATMITFWKVDTIAGVIFLPYLAWVSFASLLNWSIWKLNSADSQYQPLDR
ncbi:hypothetical protein K7432_012758 [Basidiobolus ranarum]|uniref:Uncharacterized protein n=1 Tax=Basidiobolus ranarum TaxID=34480 RepID=A0ABR2WKB0_9FUNG